MELTLFIPLLLVVTSASANVIPQPHVHSDAVEPIDPVDPIVQPDPVDPVESVVPVVNDQTIVQGYVPVPVVPVASVPVAAAPAVAPVVGDQVVAQESVVSPVVAEPAPAAAEPDLGLAEPIEHAQKLLIVLDTQVKKLLPEEDQVVVSGDVKPDQYSGGLEPVVPEVPVPVDQEASLRQINQISSLLDQIDRVEKRLSQTIDSLADRRRYILSNGLRPVLGYVQRVQSDLQTLNRRLQGGAASSSSSAARQGSGTPVDQTALDSIRNTVQEINRTISDMIVRIRNTLNLPSISNIFSGSTSTTGRPAV